MVEFDFGVNPLSYPFYSSDLDLYSLRLQYGHIGWYSVKLVLHLGQYQAMANSLTLSLTQVSPLDLHHDMHELDQLWSAGTVQKPTTVQTTKAVPRI